MGSIPPALEKVAKQGTTNIRQHKQNAMGAKKGKNLPTTQNCPLCGKLK